MSAHPRTAYMLQIHKNPEQVNQYIQQLIIEEQADVYIHIDKRNYEQIKEKIIKNPHVKILQQNIYCEWGDISQVATTLMLLREVLYSQNSYDYVCLRSGQDLLVKDGFKDFLQENKGKIFFGFRDIDEKDLILMKMNWPKVTRARYTGIHPFRIYRRLIYDLYHRGINLFPNSNKWPKEYSFYTGSQWFTIPLEVARYIVDFVDENEWYYRYFEKTLAPDEWFFHTMIMNSHYKKDVVRDNLFYINMGDSFSDRGSPIILTSKDIHLIEKSNQFFARKFDEDIDNSVIEYFVNKVKFGSKTLISSK